MLDSLTTDILKARLLRWKNFFLLSRYLEFFLTSLKNSTLPDSP